MWSLLLTTYQDGLVFHAAEVAPRAAVQRQSTNLRFDQFFAGNEEPAAPVKSAPGPAAPGKGEEDVAQFNAGLKGLKG